MQNVASTRKSGGAKIALFYPEADPGASRAHVPLSATVLAASLEKAGHFVRIFDERVDRDVEKQLLEFLNGCTCLGVSSLTGLQIHGGLRISKTVKRHYPELPIVWGGWHPSLMPEQTCRNPNVDVVVVGQGQETMLELVSALQEGLPLNDVTGVVFKNGSGKIVRTCERGIGDIRLFPSAAYHLLDVEKYIHPMRSPQYGEIPRNLSYISSQGCPHRCAFCCVQAIYGRRWVALNAERVLDDLQTLKEKYDIDGISFEDSNFFVNKKRVRAICKGLIDRGLNIKWQANGRTEQVSRFSAELLGLVRESGCWKILVGAESGAEMVLDLLTKDATVEDTMRFAEMANDHGIVPDLSFMVGFPGEPEADLRQTTGLIGRLCSRHRLLRIKLFFYTPYPGTRLYELALKHGLRPPDSLDGWSRWTLRSINVPWITKAHRDRVSSFVNIYFPLASQCPAAAPRNIRGKLKGIGRRLLTFVARMRLRFNCFAFPVDALLIKYYRRWRGETEGIPYT